MEFSINGYINAKGELGLYNKAELKQFTKQNPNTKVIVTVRIYPENSTEAMKGRYYHKILNEFVEGLKYLGDIYTKEQTDEKLRALCPITREEKWTGEIWDIRIKEISELSNQEFIEYLEWLDRLFIEYINPNN